VSAPPLPRERRVVNRAIGRVGVAIIVLLLLLVAQLTYLQIVDADNLAKDPRNVRGALRDANRPRGDIVTADGVVVARSTRVDDGTEFKYQRSYPEGPLYAQVVGYQSFVLGNIGVERNYNDQLAGHDSLLELKNVSSLGEQNTGTVVLSIRDNVQKAAALALKGQRGSVVAINPRTGEVLALYSNPSYDPNPLTGHDTKAVNAFHKELVANPDKPDLARAFRERYPPGSTFKTVTASVALEEGVATPDRAFPVLRELDLPQTDNTLKNFGGRSCGGTLAESFKSSCNTTFGQLGLDLADSFVPGMEQFGIGEAPPIDVSPGAVPSIGPQANTFQDSQPLFAFAGIGQGDVTTTPLQMALVAAGLANDGVIMEPHVVKEILDAKGDSVRRIDDREWKTAVSPATADAVTAMMVTVVQGQGGTGTSARIAGVTVAGKTGTAQAPNNKVHAWFVAFAPAENPTIAVAVIVEGGGNAGNEATGGAVAAPIAAAVIRAALQQ
jgi:penicillin-binding protein A